MARRKNCKDCGSGAGFLRYGRCIPCWNRKGQSGDLSRGCLQCAQHVKKFKDLLGKYAEAKDALAEWEELYNDLRTEEYRQRTGQLPA